MSTHLLIRGRPNRWVIVQRKQNPSEPNVKYHDLEGWTREADDDGLIIFGKSVRPLEYMVEEDSRKDNLIFIAWDQIAAIYFDQDKELD